MTSEFRTRRVDIKAEDTTAASLQQLDGELAEQSKAYDRDQVSKFHFGGSYAVERDSAQRCERGFLKRRFRVGIAGNFRDEQPGHACHFCVHGKTDAGAGDAVTRLQIRDP